MLVLLYLEQFRVEIPLTKEDASFVIDSLIAKDEEEQFAKTEIQEAVEM